MRPRRENLQPFQMVIRNQTRVCDCVSISATRGGVVFFVCDLCFELSTLK